MAERLPLVGVEWGDAHGDAVKVIDAESLHTWHKSCIITTFGLLVRDDEAGVTVVMEDLRDGDWRGPTFIPRSLIQAIWLVSANPYKRRALKKVDNSPPPVVESGEGGNP